MPFAKFKTKPRSYEDTEKMHPTAHDDNVMKARVQLSARPAMTETAAGQRATNFREVSNKAYAFLTSDRDAEIQPGRGVKMNGLMVDTGATSHIIMDIAKFKKFDDRFQAETHCVELADGTRSNGIAERRGEGSEVNAPAPCSGMIHGSRALTHPGSPKRPATGNCELRARYSEEQEPRRLYGTTYLQAGVFPDP
ncbi:hypothetical protein AAFF_G00181670 [Aldrovandia affinis]|uniref:Uncharacterized protein n=1 Tax=Aldrovandia affinis TaxID=143900 RepID=A0AAD7W693_9TELE|nr:hypothetical protein AAFF_G00181670 [Aldrovandia affinis]